MKIFPYFIYFLTIRIQQSTENMHDNILNDGEFRENRCSESHSLYRGVSEHLYVPHFPIWAKLTIVDRHRMLLGDYEFHENRCREVRTSLTGLKEIKLQCMR